MDPDIAAALYGGGAPEPHETVMPVQRIEGDPEAGMSGLEKLGKLLKEQRAPVLLRGDTPGDIASGIAGGLTGNLDQRLPFGIGDAIKADRESAAARNPGLMRGADVVGMVASPIGIEGRAEGILANAGRSAATGGMYGAARAVGDANPDDDARTQAMQALAAGATGVGAGAVAGGVGGVLGEVAPVARRFAMGGTSKDYGDIVKEQGTRAGIDYIQKDLGKIPEQQGLTNLLVPQSRAGLAKRAAARAEDMVGPELGATLRRAEAEIPAGAIDRQAVMGPLQREADALDNAARPGSRQYDQTISQAARAPFETPTDVAELKRAFEAESYAKGAINGSRESRYATAQKAGADATRAHLSDIMNSADPVTAAQFHKSSRDYADTKLVEGMAANATKYDFAAPLAGAGLGGFTGYETGHDIRSTAGGAVAGALAGRYGADLTANLARGGERILESPALARLGGQLASKVNPVSAQEIPDAQLPTRTSNMDLGISGDYFLPDVQRSVERIHDPAAHMPPYGEPWRSDIFPNADGAYQRAIPAAQPGPPERMPSTSNMDEDISGPYFEPSVQRDIARIHSTEALPRYGEPWDNDGRRGSLERRLDFPAGDARYQRSMASDVSGDTRGHLIPQAIQDALRDNKLGPYSDEFARAAMAPEPGALGVTYSRLSKDPQFAPYKRLLQEMTGDMP